MNNMYPNIGGNLCHVNQNIIGKRIYHVSVVCFSPFFFTSKSNMILLVPDVLKIMIIAMILLNIQMKVRQQESSTKTVYKNDSNDDEHCHMYKITNNLQYTKLCVKVILSYPRSIR